MTAEQYDIGMIGLGVMGRNLVLNLADHGASVAGFDLDDEKVAALDREAGDRPVRGFGSAAELVEALAKPRTVLLLVPAGRPVDAVIEALLPHLDEGDAVIDGGNSHFSDTNRRAAALAAKHMHFLGMGISGGADGARHGPSMMPGGDRAAWERVAGLLKAASAHVGDEPCVTFLGPGSAGHYVKMVHNGIEYGFMQLIAESYDLLRRGAGLSNDDLAGVFADWNRGELASFLVEIAATIFRQPDPRGDGRLIDAILDAARQKGTGKWTSQDAMDQGVPVPGIDTAVAQRQLSALKDERERAAALLDGPSLAPPPDRATFVGQVRDALDAALVITFAQGMALLRQASEAYGYGLDLAAVARIWRGGCIIRADLLEVLRKAFATEPDLPNLLLDPVLAGRVRGHQEALRGVVGRGVAWGIPVPAFAASLAYYDAYRTARLPANLIQAQRDCFGSHTYERVDAEGSFHTEWGKET